MSEIEEKIGYRFKEKSFILQVYILYSDRGEDWIQFQGEIIYSPGTIYYTDIEEKIGYSFKEKSFILQVLYTIQR